MHRTQPRLHGFTLIELMVVIAIIAVLATILLPTYAHALKQGDKAAALTHASAVNGALNSYLAAHPELTTANVTPLSCMAGVTLNVETPYVMQGNQANRPGFTTPNAKVTGCQASAATDRTVSVTSSYHGGTVTVDGTGTVTYGP